VKRMKIAFLTGTRADYGKLKPLMQACESDAETECMVYAIGMHLLEEYGATINDIRNDRFSHLYTPEHYCHHDKMELNLAETIVSFSSFVDTTQPDLIVVHGDRVEPLAGAIVGVMNNTYVAHVEGGEVTGTADEFMRHAVTKLSNLHFVSNEEAKLRLLQLGEREETIYVIGSPDIDIMLSDRLPALDEVKKKQGIPFDRYAILSYHPVTTAHSLARDVEQLVDAVEASGLNYVVIMPNDDKGSDVIQTELKRLASNLRFRFFASIPFESYLTLLRHAEFIIGNSSAGVREACVYGVPAIDVGTRQNNRYHPAALRNIQKCGENADELLRCIASADRHRVASSYFGNGHSAEQFIRIIKNMGKMPFQKQFVDTAETAAAINNYINEVCF